MKPLLEDIKKQQGHSSCYAYRFKMTDFEFKWHYHPEYELTYIIKGNGSRLVGNSYESFSDGDLVLLGSNLPHTWVGKSNEGEDFEAIVIQFSKEFIHRFLDFEESTALRKMIELSKKGLFFNDEKHQIKEKLIEIINDKGLHRILRIVTVLEQLAQYQCITLSTTAFQNIISKESEIRINKVCLFIQNRFSEKINLKQVADLIYLTESNFCKFFKKATGKTYSDYLNEIRINEASHLLLQTEKTINQIAFECGFETLSYFNRVFLKKKNTTPSNFRKVNAV